MDDYTTMHISLISFVLLLVTGFIACELDYSSEYLQELNTTVIKLKTFSNDARNSFVIATTVNQGFIHHLFNFDCFVKKLNLTYIVFSLDAATHSNLTTPPHRNQFHSIYHRLPGENDVASSASEFRSLEFNVITARKIAAVSALLRLGLDVLFLDVDVILLQDPRPYIFWDNVHYVHSLNYPCDAIEQHWDYFYNRRIEGNTGFYFVRSTPQTVSLWEEVYVWMKRSYRIDDQTYFWRILRGLGHRTLPLGQCQHLTKEYVQQNISLCMLNSCMFSSGMLSTQSYHDRLFVNLAMMHENPVTIHANFIKSKDKKVAALQEYHLWLFSGFSKDGSHLCKSFNLPSFMNISQSH